MDNKMDYKENEEENIIIEEQNIDGQQDIPKDAVKSKKKEKEEKPVNIGKEIISWILIIVIALAASFLVNRFVIVNATVPSGSMENTIKTGNRIIGWRFAYTFGEPERGDIIIFKFPDDETQNYVKRIIGLPGDTVEIISGEIFINGSNTPLEENYLKEEWVYTANEIFEVPEDSYFMLGDNRNSSNDSRSWQNKYVKKDKILGKASICYWPFSDMGILK